METELFERCLSLVSELGIAETLISAEPLTGGVASDIAVVQLADKKICIKFALAKLRAKAAWFAPVHRNAAEYAWLKVAAEVAPEAAVKLLGHSPSQHGFAMEFIEGDSVYLWKQALLDSQAPQGEAAKIGALLGKIHQASTQTGFDASKFQNQDDFWALRIEPYLNYTAENTPAFRTAMLEMAESLKSASQVLVHGDASPKNILFRDAQPIILDAECATMGDASFDPAFCLNHLLLKSVHLPSMSQAYLAEAKALWTAYKPYVTWEDAAQLEAKICRLLPMLFFARVAGKSPVEYLNKSAQTLVAKIAEPLILSPVLSLNQLIDQVGSVIQKALTMPAISSIKARRIWDSRGNPTVEVEMKADTGQVARGIAPSGASTGSREALELRDGGSKQRGKNVSQAIANVDGPLAAALLGFDLSDMPSIDAAIEALDPSPLKSTLGGNATVATSLAAWNLGAATAGKPLWRFIADSFGTSPSIPLPEIQIFGGGAHAGRRVDIQDFMIAVPGASSFDEVMEITNEVYFAAGDIMASRGKLAGIADEGGWWPDFASNEEALETLVMAIEKAGEKPGDKVAITLDVAASEFGKDERYKLALEDRELDSGQLIDQLGAWLKAYPIVSIEDPLGEDDTAGMIEFTKRFGKDIQIIGDDYLVTNAQLVAEAAKAGACNSVLVKVNQTGTVGGGIGAWRAATAHGWTAVVSARSGETEDVTIAHLAAGLRSGQLKVGSFARSERMAKWNECLRIQDQMDEPVFAGGANYKDTWWGRQS